MSEVGYALRSHEPFPGRMQSLLTDLYSIVYLHICLHYQEDGEIRPAFDLTHDWMRFYDMLPDKPMSGGDPLRNRTRLA